LQCFGTDNNVTEIRGIVCKLEHQGQSLAALAKHLSTRDDAWDWIDWGVLRDDAWAQDTAPLGSIHSDRQVVDYQLHMPATWEEFRSSRSRNIKESLRKCYNSLKRANLSAQLQVISTPDECPAALQTFFHLHAHRACTVGTVVHADVFRGDRDKEFLTEYALEMAKRGQLRIFQLHVGGQVVATRIAFLFGDELYLYYSGYDTEWGKFSVMTTLLAEALKWAAEQKIPIVNLSTGADVSKLRWDPTPTSFRAAIQVASALHSRLAFAAYHRARRQPARSKLLGWIRR
jgi:CelD/BcsL family acetyltransferase involved in cellulose biosynthesis